MVVRKVNGIQATNGEVNIPMPTMQYANENRPIKIWGGYTTITGGSGEWTIDYSEVGFSDIKTIQVTPVSNTTTTADKPLGCHIASNDLNSAKGKAYKVTSAGLLAAMQQINAEDGTGLYVLVIGF